MYTRYATCLVKFALADYLHLERSQISWPYPYLDLIATNNPPAQEGDAGGLSVALNIVNILMVPVRYWGLTFQFQ